MCVVYVRVSVCMCARVRVCVCVCVVCVCARAHACVCSVCACVCVCGGLSMRGKMSYSVKIFRNLNCGIDSHPKLLRMVLEFAKSKSYSSCKRKTNKKLSK